MMEVISEIGETFAFFRFNVPLVSNKKVNSDRKCWTYLSVVLGNMKISCD